MTHYFQWFFLVFDSTGRVLAVPIFGMNIARIHAVWTRVPQMVSIPFSDGVFAHLSLAFSFFSRYTTPY